jgi:hypothetical protein
MTLVFEVDFCNGKVAGAAWRDGPELYAAWRQGEIDLGGCDGQTSVFIEALQVNSVRRSGSAAGIECHRGKTVSGRTDPRRFLTNVA